MFTDLKLTSITLYNKERNKHYPIEIFEFTNREFFSIILEIINSNAAKKNYETVINEILVTNEFYNDGFEGVTYYLSATALPSCYGTETFSYELSFNINFNWGNNDLLLRKKYVEEKNNITKIKFITTKIYCSNYIFKLQENEE